MTLSECMDFINSFDKKGKAVKDLSRAKSLIECIGNPHEDLKFIHIAGTNGKGSTAQMLSEMCILEGKKTGLFTSPYIFTYSDRIKVNNENISDEILVKLGEIVKKAVEKTKEHRYSQFEITMAIALLYFKEKKCDIVVWETGLGGLMDCTNIVIPEISVITSIDFDHTAILGSTLNEIATQKAGIIKKSIPCVLSAKNATETIKVVEKIAKDKNSRLIIPDETKLEVIKSDVFGNEFVYKGEKYKTSMCGEHQIINCLTAIETAKILGISNENIKRGSKKALVPARVQVISKEPLIILDGSHNPAGTKALSKMLKTLNPPALVTAVIGMLEEKQVELALENLLPVVSEFVCVEGFNPKEVPAKSLAKLANNLGARSKPLKSLGLGLEYAMTKNKPIVVCGSLYLASEYLNKKSLLE